VCTYAIASGDNLGAREGYSAIERNCEYEIYRAQHQHVPNGVVSVVWVRLGRNGATVNEPPRPLLCFELMSTVEPQAKNMVEKEPVYSMSRPFENKMPKFLSKRIVNLGGFLVCAALLGYAYYLQFANDLEPCPLCIFQRVAFLAVGVLFLAAALHGPKGAGARIYGVLIAVAALIGAGIAGRHVWLQHLPPDQVPECGPGLDYMLQAFPLSDAVKMVFTGSGECAEVSWVFLGMSMPAWTLLCFAALGLIALVRNFMRDDT
jgi:disulfide bond formation protein DsbB